MFKKKWMSLSLIALLIFSFFPLANFSANHVEASETIKKQVLEIVDSGGTKLNGILDESKFEVTTLRMKQFVALREELDGKYDVIYIGDGTYSPEKLGGTNDNNRASSHNTTLLDNDITELKAKEIMADFVEKNQLVVLHRNSINANNKIKHHFGKYVNAPTNNVKFVTNLDQFKNIVNQFNFTRPRVNMVEKPEIYSSEQSKKYTANEKITFKFNAQASNINNLTANLYIDSNFNHRFESDELVQSVELSSTNGTLEYVLPKGYSGLRYWKLEVVDRNTRLKDVETGVFRFKGEKVNIKVLQVTAGSNDQSRLTLETNMKQSYLSSDDYKITIDTVSMGNFTDGIGDHSHTKLNGKYDMLIFGFRDSYNGNAVLKDNAMRSVKKFIETGQSVMFTHDTIFNQNNIWVNNFMDATGQKNPWTNLGFGAPQQSENTKKVNDGLLTQFPFLLGQNIKINNTHNQYYTLDLEDPNIIPWYNIIGGHRDNDDSWNHYYTYSKGNITYSGTGHKNTVFPDQEQRLFVNTMFRAFLGSNTAPSVNVLTPSEGRDHLSSQDLELVYEAYDLDLTDRFLKTRIYLNGSVTPIYVNNELANGKIVRYKVDSDLLQAGETTIRIEVEDATGAVGYTERKVNIQDADLEINKVISKTKAVVDEEVKVTYSISAGDLSFSDDGVGIFPYGIVEGKNLSNELVLIEGSSPGNYGWLNDETRGGGAAELKDRIKNENYAKFFIGDEIYPQPGNIESAYQEVIDWLDGQTKTVVIPLVDQFPNGMSSTMTIKSFSEFSIYERNGIVYLKFIRDLTDLGNSKLNNIIIEDFLPAGVKLVDSNVPGMQTENTQNGTKITISLNEISLKDLHDQGSLQFEYSIKSQDPGIYVMDQSTFKYKLGNSSEITIPFNPITLEVVQPVTGVEIRNTATDIFVGQDPRRLFFDIVPENATNKSQAANSAQWTSSDPSVVSIDKNGFITAHKKGNVTITVTVDDVDGVNGGNPFTDTITLNAVLPLEGITIEGNSELFVGDEVGFSISTEPPGVDVGNATWSITDGNGIIQLQPDGTVKALQPGSAVIKVEITFMGETFTAIRSINVKELRIDPGAIEVNINETNSSLSARIFTSSTVSETATGVIWSISNSNVATIDSNGRVSGIAEGTATVTARITVNGKERVATANVTVKKVPLTGISSDTVIVLEKGTSKSISLQFTPANATNKAVTYSINNSSYATVDSSGQVTGVDVRYGYRDGVLTIVPAAQITVTSIDNPSVFITIDVVVVEEGYEENGNNESGWRW